MATKLDTRQSVNRSALAMIGSLANDSLDTILPKINDELAKLFEDRNISLVDGGLISFPFAATTVTFSTNLRLHINSQVAGGAPTVIDLGSTTRTLSADGRMVYAVIDRIAGTASVTDDATTLPAQTSANQEVVLIAKRSDSGDGTPRVYFRGGFSLSRGQSSRFGYAAEFYASEFKVRDATDVTKFWASTASGATTGTNTSLAFVQTANRVLTLPDITDTLVSRTNTETLSNKQVQFSVSSDATTTGSNATLQAFTTGVIRLTNGSLLSVAGIPAGSTGQFLLIENKTGNSLLINNEDTGASAADRIQTGNGGNVSIGNNATLAFTYDATSQRWQLTAGSGSGSGSGSKNYLSAVTTSQSSTPNTGNGNFELGSTTGWSLGTTGTLTNGLPTGSPTFGSGASGNLSFGVVNTGQLAGSFSGSLVSSAATTVGDMLASDAFNIDNEDQAKILTWKFYYKAQTNPANANWSGTSSNSFGVAVWDVTNSVWLPTTASFGMTQSTGTGIASGTVQTFINTTQLRLVVYNVNATSGAITLYFDDFSFGPQIVPFAAPVGDWNVFSMVITSTGSSPARPGSGIIDDRAAWRRVGDSMEIYFTYHHNGAAGTAGTGTYLFNLPSGYTIDSSKFTIGADTNPRNSVGFAACDSGGGGNTGFVKAYTSTQLAMVVPANGSSVATGVGASNYSLGTSPIAYTFVAIVPIVGWSSNVQMSSDTDTRVVIAKAIGNPASASSGNIIIVPSLAFDTHGAYNTSTGRFTVPVSGYYRVYGAAASSNTNVSMYLYKNAVLNTILRGWVSAGDGAIAFGFSTSVQCSAGDILDLRPNATLDIADINVTYERVSGPSVIAASEVVAMEANANPATGGTLVNSTNNDVVFGNRVNDTHNAYNASTGIYTVPVSGWYCVDACIFFSGTFANNGNIQMHIRVNGTNVRSRDLNNSSSSGSMSYDVHAAAIKLNAGDTLQIRVVPSSWTTLSYGSPGASFSYFNVNRIK